MAIETNSEYWVRTAVHWYRRRSRSLRDRAAGQPSTWKASMTDRLTSITTAFAVATITAVAAVISYRHAYGWSVPRRDRPTYFDVAWHLLSGGP
jgi:hypothetical protein